METIFERLTHNGVSTPDKDLIGRLTRKHESVFNGIKGMENLNPREVLELIDVTNCGRAIMYLTFLCYMNYNTGLQNECVDKLCAVMEFNNVCFWSPFCTCDGI